MKMILRFKCFDKINLPLFASYLIRNTVSGEYRHPVPVSPDTVIQCRHPVPDRYRIHLVPYPVPPLIRYRHPELDDGFGYWIPVIRYRYRQIPVPDDSPDNGRRTLHGSVIGLG